MNITKFSINRPVGISMIVAFFVVLGLFSYYRIGVELPPAKGKILGPASYCKIDGFSGEIGFIDALEHKFCDKCNRVRLTSEGFLKLCLNHKEGTDLRTPLRKGKSDEELLELLTAAINPKPQEHLFLEKNDHRDKRNMYQVGG